GDGRDLTVRPRQVLGDLPPYAAEPRPPPLPRVAARRAADVVIGDAAAGPGALDGVDVDAELARDLPDDRRRLGLRRPLGRRGGVLADRDEHRPDRHDRALVDLDPPDAARRRRRDLDGRLVGRDL